ncbi:pyridoxamine 5'-phosphate oxidase [Taibaiella lutea]|uniref:Pyridoxine/pyridoxamine 5'-phosphate oxidase n=1 Tax=Taibaiella lutea TaxID=2608001 RepID=A0A5M6CNN2_9BACT|nr:pyridoxamine 5'-phosphate oxidase [Taibaiella lutea]KAA5536744.1 pyridoxamine 5'-phosphate oxidase [Taibaiella lutea]
MINSSEHIAKIRADYKMATLSETEVGNDPLLFFQKWFSQAEAAGITEVNAMTLATANMWGMPSARIVLLKGLDEEGFTFYTNYDSEKGRQIADEDSVALLFFWKELERQVRIEGTARKISAEESDAYFHSRPQGSQISAVASPQSEIIEGRSVLENKVIELEQQYAEQEIPRPGHWGGYKVIPEKVEFWQGRSNRLHDRIVFFREPETDNGEGELPGYSQWETFRLAP